MTTPPPSVPEGNQGLSPSRADLGVRPAARTEGRRSAGKKAFKTTAALIRSALHDAICDRESFADAHGAGTPEAAQALQEVAEYKAYLRKRFGQQTLADALVGLPTISLSDLPLMEPGRPNQEFNAAPVDLTVPRNSTTPD